MRYIPKDKKRDREREAERERERERIEEMLINFIILLLYKLTLIVSKHYRNYLLIECRNYIKLKMFHILMSKTSSYFNGQFSPQINFMNEIIIYSL